MLGTIPVAVIPSPINVSLQYLCHTIRQTFAMVSGIPSIREPQSCSSKKRLQLQEGRLALELCSTHPSHCRYKTSFNILTQFHTLLPCHIRQETIWQIPRVGIIIRMPRKSLAIQESFTLAAPGNVPILQKRNDMIQASLVVRSTELGFAHRKEDIICCQNPLFHHSTAYNCQSKQQSFLKDMNGTFTSVSRSNVLVKLTKIQLRSTNLGTSKADTSYSPQR